MTSTAGDGGSSGRSDRRGGANGANGANASRRRRSNQKGGRANQKGGRSNQEIGAAGEDQAASWYERHGYRIVARNWRCREGELDLVLTKRRLLVICEVKSRSSLAFGSPLEAITEVKVHRLRVLAARFIEESGARPSGVRFDVACILAGELDVVEGAF